MEAVTLPLNENQARFIDEYFAQAPYNQTAAYMRAYGVDYDTANVCAVRLMKHPVVQAEIARRQVPLREKFALEADDVLREIFLIATADPRDLSEHYVGSCRYCHGDGFQYQRTPAEFARDVEQHIALRNAEKNPDPLALDFNVRGGVGFNARKPPHLDCPECFGEGVGYEVFKDTRTLSKAAARLYSGVKKTRDGLELKTRSQDKAIEMAAQTLGLFKSKVEMTGPGGGPLQSISTVTTDPIEAARIYQQMVSGG